MIMKIKNNIKINKTPQFSLILTCFNEEDNLKKTVEDSLLVMGKYFKRFEIIIVEDKSKDRSLQIAKSLVKKYQEVTVIENSINFGQGISLLIGLEAAKGDLIMHNGADRPFNIADLKKILPLFPKNDIVIVVRSNRSAYSFWRKLSSWGNNLLRWLLFGLHFSDLNFVQVFKKKVIKDIPIVSRSAAFVTQELILNAIQKGYKIAEIRLPYYRRTGGISQHGKKRDILWALIDMINFWLDFKKK